MKPGVCPGCIVDKSILKEGEEDKRDTNVVPHINCLKRKQINVVLIKLANPLKFMSSSDQN